MGNNEKPASRSDFRCSHAPMSWGVKCAGPVLLISNGAENRWACIGHVDGLRAIGLIKTEDSPDNYRRIGRRLLLAERDRRRIIKAGRKLGAVQWGISEIEQVIKWYRQEYQRVRATLKTQANKTKARA